MVGTEERVKRYERQRNYGAMTGRQVRRVVRKGRQHGDACGVRELREHCYLWPGHEDDPLYPAHESYSFIWSAKPFWRSRLKAKVIGHQIWNHTKEYDGRPADVRSVTGKEPITEEGRDED